MNIIKKVKFNKQIYGCLDGVIELILADLVPTSGPLVHIARDDSRMMQVKRGLQICAPDLPILTLPAWDCLPYDRVSPHSALISKRVDSLSRLAHPDMDKPQIVLTTVNSWLQKVPPPNFFIDSQLVLKAGQTIAQTHIAEFLIACGFHRTQTVREYGEFSLRGGIMDIFALADVPPVRLDFFGDDIETIRHFDSLSQRSLGPAGEIHLRTAGEYRLDEAVISRFRQNYLSLFGGKAAQDPLYEAVSAGTPPAGIEHWLALLHEELVPLSTYVSGWSVSMDVDGFASAFARLEQIGEFYEARCQSITAGTAGEGVYRPLPPDTMFLNKLDIDALGKSDHVASFSSFAAPDKNFPKNDLRQNDLGQNAPPQDDTTQNDTGARLVPGFTGLEARAIEAVATFIRKTVAHKPVILTAGSKGAADRLSGLIGGHLDTRPPFIDSLKQVQKKGIYTLIWPLDSGFETDHALCLSEQDIFGTKLARPQGKRRRGDEYLREVSALDIGDLVVHIDHGIGRYEGLEIIDSAGVAHDCMHLRYAGGDRLYLPVENIELLSRYGQSSGDAHLDRLGGAGWQSRKAKIKGRIKDMADQLMRTAAYREVAKAESLAPPEGLFDEFCARFGHIETDDQLEAIADVLGDLHAGKATDRLICGDVGFGKTEVALRAAFIATMSGYQAALITPTTLLARQHSQLFAQRFKGFPVKLATLSRMVTPKEAVSIKKGLESGEIQMVIGTHALLSHSIRFDNLGLLIIDEEQNFGVAQKERLKKLKSDIHVLTLSATPIPRTLQLALSGVREMSMIATPPVDRLAVRTFIGSWDGVVLKEALQREKFRKGQSFVVCPRIADLTRVYDKLQKLVPDMRILSAHGRMASSELDEVMTRFGEGEADILLSTNIIESGLDIPNANTIIIHRADMFGLSQLYQLRGRVGRSKQRAYAYLTTDPHMTLSKQARRRLDVMQTLDQLGAGFSLASYDLDIRGAGNLLGEEQSGHVREVGIELYQDMLKQAIEVAQKKEFVEEHDQWSPQISLGTHVMIPDDYVSDLSVRLSLYRRIATLTTQREIDEVWAELIDRFGDVPESVKNLLEIVELKPYCKSLNIQKIDVGIKGFSIQFRHDHFASPEALIGWITKKQGAVQMKADHRLVIKEDLVQIADRARRVKFYLKDMMGLVEAQNPD